MASSSDSDSDGPTRPAIWDAIYTFDAEALRRELAAGVDPNVSYDGYTPLFNLVLVRAARYPEERIQERLECISLLLEAGASVDFRHLYPGDTNGRTVLHRVAHNRSPAYTAVIARRNSLISRSTCSGASSSLYSTWGAIKCAHYC